MAIIPGKGIVEGTAKPVEASELEAEADASGYRRGDWRREGGGDTHLPASESDFIKEAGTGASGGAPAPPVSLPPD
jgi:hypothetical protein